MMPKGKEVAAYSRGSKRSARNRPSEETANRDGVSNGWKRSYDNLPTRCLRSQANGTHVALKAVMQANGESNDKSTVTKERV